MARPLPHVDPLKPRGLLYRAYAALVGTRVMGWVSRLVVWRLDPYLMRLTRGRFGLGMGLPTALLETRGARTGEARSNGVIYFADRVFPAYAAYRDRAAKAGREIPIVQLTPR